MLEFILVPLAAVRVFFRTRQDNAIEILALRQQLAVLKRKRPRPRLHPLDRLFWTGLRRVWSRWGRGPRGCETADRSRLAPDRIPALLEVAIPSARRQTENDC